jgi:hypothetical protein
MDGQISRKRTIDMLQELAKLKARWRGLHLPIADPVAISKAANKPVVPWRW